MLVCYNTNITYSVAVLCTAVCNLFAFSLEYDPFVINHNLMFTAVHTMEELKLTGNHLKGSRPLITFSTNFDEQPHWKLVKEMITQVYNYFDMFTMHVAKHFGTS